MSISEYYSKLFDIIYTCYGDVDGIEIIMEHGALSHLTGVGKKVHLRFITVDSNETNNEYFIFLVSRQMSDLDVVEQEMISSGKLMTQKTINLPNPLSFIKFLLTNTSLFQLNVKTIK